MRWHDGKVSWVRKFTHGLSPHFSNCKKFYTTQSTRMDPPLCAWHIHTNECELLLKMAFSTVALGLPLLAQRNVTHVNLSSSSSSLPVTCSIALVSAIFFVLLSCHLIRIESKIYAYQPNAHEIRIYCDGFFINRMHQLLHVICDRRDTYMRHLFDISSFVFTLSKKKGNEKKIQ